MSFGTWLFTRLGGTLVGTDATGTRYYQERRDPRRQRARRWAIYPRGAEEATLVPPEWHAWLHYTVDAPLAGARLAWQKPHQPNLTGTPFAYRPPGHDYKGGRRAAATGDYQAWTPES